MTTFLLVDDDEIFRSRVARALTRRDFEVVQAGSHAEALAMAREHHLDRAVVDLRLGGPDGLEVVRDLHREDPDLAIVVLTGYGSIATTVDAMNLGASHYLSKPADVDDILNAFERIERGPDVTAAPVYDEAPSLARAEWEHIQRVLSDCGGNISEASRRLGIHRRSLQRKLQKYPPQK